MYLQDNRGRIYKVGDVLIEISSKVIEKLLEWNMQPYKTIEFYDSKFVSALLLVCVGVENLSQCKISEEIKKFIKGAYINVALFVQKLIFFHFRPFSHSC